MVVPQSFCAVHGHKIQFRERVLLGNHIPRLLLVRELRRTAKVKGVEPVTPQQQYRRVRILLQYLPDNPLHRFAHKEILPTLSGIFAPVYVLRIGLDHDRTCYMFGRNQAFAYLRRVLLYETTGYVDYFLGVPVSFGNTQFQPVPKGFLELGEQRDIRTCIGINGLPIVAHGHDLCIAEFAQLQSQIKPLAGNVLILVDYDIFEPQPLPLDFLFAEHFCRTVYHVFKIYRLLFFQTLGVF